MTNEEIEEKRKGLVEILNISDPQRDKVEEARNLALEIGASIYTVYSGRDSNIAFSELVANIHHALQTATMINMSKSSANMCEVACRNYKIASKATKIAFGSAIAAWVAVLGNVLIAVLSK